MGTFTAADQRPAERDLLLRIGRRRASLAVGFALAVALLAPAAACAATLTVTTTADSSDPGCTPSLCSFRDALAAAGTNDTIVLPAGTYKGTMLGGNGVWAPSGGPYTIQGAGATKTIIDGNGLSRTFAFYGQITVTGVTVTGGVAPNAGCACGGAFEVRQGGYLTLINSVVQGNSAPSGGGGIDVDTQSKAILQNVVVRQNTSPGSGGGIHVGPVTGSTGTLVMTNVTISGTSTTGGASGAGLDNQGSTTGTNVTFAGNASAADGGGVANETGGVLTLNASTFATNTASGFGAGIRNVAASGSVTLRNTIVADGCSGTATPPVTSQGHNLDAATSCAFAAPGDITTKNPQLGPLADNGGNTGLPTFALAAGSPAIGAGDNASCPATDARGVPRPQGLVCDIGAFELAPPTVKTGAVSGITTTSANVGGTVNPNLRGAIVHVEYGTTTLYGNSTPTQDAGTGTSAVVVGATLTGLAPGTTYHYRLVATNGDGTGTGADATFTTASASAAPIVSSVAQTAKTWRENNALASISAKKKKPAVGTIFSFVLDQKASTTLNFTQQVTGRRVGGKCVAQSAKNRRKPRCKRIIVAGTLTFTGHPGTNRVRFGGRISRTKKLRPGRYVLVISAINAAGQHSAPQSLPFTIVK